MTRSGPARDVSAPFIAFGGWCSSAILVAVTVAIALALGVRAWRDLTSAGAAGGAAELGRELATSALLSTSSTALVAAIGFFAAVATVSPAIGATSGRWLNASLRFGPAMPAVVLAAAVSGALVVFNGMGWYREHPVGTSILALCALQLPIITERFRFVLRSVPRRWRVAAMAAGASPVYALSSVGLPRAWPGIGAVLLNGAAEMFAETVVVVTLVTGFTTPPAAAALWQRLAQTPFPAGTEAQVASLVVLIIALRLCAAAIYRRFGNTR